MELKRKIAVPSYSLSNAVGVRRLAPPGPGRLDVRLRDGFFLLFLRFYAPGREVHPPIARHLLGELPGTRTRGLVQERPKRWSQL